MTLSKEIIGIIQNMLLKGTPKDEIAKTLNVGIVSIYNVMNGLHCSQMSTSRLSRNKKLDNNIGRVVKSIKKDQRRVSSTEIACRLQNKVSPRSIRTPNEIFGIQL